MTGGELYSILESSISFIGNFIHFIPRLQVLF